MTEEEFLKKCIKIIKSSPSDDAKKEIAKLKHPTQNEKIGFESAEKFDPQKGKAFNYMTTCILNHFRQLWRSARNYQELKKRYNDIIQLKFGLDSSTRRRDRIQGKNFDKYHDKA